MPLLASIAHLEIVTQRPPGELVGNAFAELMLELASNKVTDYCGHPEWETSGVGDDEPPRAARRIALFMAKRVFENPDAEVAWGVGPLNARSIDWQAYGLTLTPPEEAELAALAAAISDAETGGLWTLSISGHPNLTEDVFLDDVYGLQPIPYGDRSQAWAFTPPEA
jgi:hypothetical protein